MPSHTHTHTTHARKHASTCTGFCSLRAYRTKHTFLVRACLRPENSQFVLVDPCILPFTLSLLTIQTGPTLVFLLPTEELKPDHVTRTCHATFTQSTHFGNKSERQHPKLSKPQKSSLQNQNCAIYFIVWTWVDKKSNFVPLCVSHSDSGAGDGPGRVAGGGAGGRGSLRGAAHRHLPAHPVVPALSGRGGRHLLQHPHPDPQENARQVQGSRYTCGRPYLCAAD